MKAILIDVPTKPHYYSVDRRTDIIIATGCDGPEFLLNMKRLLCDMVTTKTHFLQDFTRMDGNAPATKPTIVDLIVSVAALRSELTVDNSTKGCL